MLKFVTPSVPEGMEQYYAAQEDGTFRLKVEGAVPESQFAETKAKLKEFRDTNTELLKKQSTLESMEALLGPGGFKPTELEGKINDLAKQRADALVADMKKAQDARIAELEGGLSKKVMKLNELQLTSAIAQAAGPNGVKSSALEDVMYRANKAFKVDDEGNLRYHEDKLDAEGKPYSVQAWLKDLAPAAPHLFEPNQGTGTPKNAKTAGPAVSSAPADPLSDIMAGLEKRNQGTSGLN